MGTHTTKTAYPFFEVTNKIPLHLVASLLLVALHEGH